MAFILGSESIRGWHPEMVANIPTVTASDELLQARLESTDGGDNGSTHIKSVTEGGAWSFASWNLPKVN
jgi:hypothetical protein